MKAKFSLLALSLLSISPFISSYANANDMAVALDLGWDSKYISEGRNNLDKGGIYWGGAALETGDLTTYAVVGRGDSTHYIEWNFGLEYSLHLHDDLETSIGYQRLEFYGDERAHDNELFAEMAYTGVHWLIPSVAYTYATEAGGYFVEVSLHSPWHISERFLITPYVTQGFDFQYATEEHNGANHFQFGIEASYEVSSNFAINAHLSHSIAMDDIKEEALRDGIQGSLDETYGGIHLSWGF
ncbi:hypothetical protein [Shewanella donghaensis]|uniref:hypothetical protein n=1 Tax=Shewanella donghaensis TaxID=238836 RepID=UPI001183F3D3|nr:hypothetical protein [Shewanella donghaensis]